MSREEHAGAVLAAKEKIGEMQALLAGLTDQQEELIGMVINAVGEDTNVHSAANARNFTLQLKDDIDAVFRVMENIVAELDNYAVNI